MTERFYLWLDFLQLRDQTVLALFGIALLLAANWLMFRRKYQTLAWFMMAGGIVTHIILLVIGV